METKNGNKKGLTLLDLFLILTVNLAALKIAGLTTMTWIMVFTPIVVFIGYVLLLVLFLRLLGGNKEE